MATSRDHEDQGAWADHPSRSLYGHNSHGFLVQQGVNLPDPSVHLRDPLLALDTFKLLSANKFDMKANDLLNRHEQFVLGDGELKISEAIDTRM